MAELPSECKVITRDYLAASDDIYGWFSELYEKSDEPESIVYIDELYSRFVSSKVFSLMSKAEQRKHNKKEFLTKVSKNVFLQHHFRERDVRLKALQLKKPAIIGFKPIPIFLEDVSDDN